MGEYIVDIPNDDEDEAKFKGMIRVNDLKKTRWDLFVILLAIWNVFSIPFEVAFAPVVMESAGFTVLNSIVDFVFLLDIIVQFRTTYYDPHTGDEIVHKWKIAKRYLLGRFWIDLFSTIPIDNIALLFTGTKTAGL